MEDVATADTMVFSGWLIAIIIGALAGWLAGKMVAGGGFGFLGNTVLGIGGAILANWALPLIGVDFGAGFFGSVVSASIGAAVVLLLIRIIKRV
ncbi:GlsB/YeaQ/YmgE family stress response membrane protein [Tropicimonas sp. TH_r6]|uniref:GlsB/YeaQ/YmgE family stress response membrane protein n=1 Tax=Tropicimonas sp. TH_r6 TaxID=3082085 RepID=UPI002955AAFE|nr:GlsB/YeaQ/YmgE family stress response membrane protein [Tropicimonas sp. TH_r6]MDV7142305.1 GlsB/YeaQ/YmgE family stress response membrane protein [Tropicimonas sp. TH_r6]